MGRVLLVDDEANMRKVLSVILAEDGHSVTEAAGARAAVGLLGAGTFDARSVYVTGVPWSGRK